MFEVNGLNESLPIQGVQQGTPSSSSTLETARSQTRGKPLHKIFPDVLTKAPQEEAPKKESSGFKKFFSKIFKPIGKLLSPIKKLFSSKTKEVKPKAAKTETAALPPPHYIPLDPVMEKSIQELIDVASDPSYGDGLTFEEVMREVYKLAALSSEYGSQIYQNQAIQDQHQKRVLSEERYKKMEEVMERAKKSDSWAKYNQLATSLGIACAVGGGIAAGSGGVLSFVALAFLVGSAINRTFGDKFTGWLSKILSPKSQEGQQKWNKAFNLGANLLSLAATIPSIMASPGGAVGTIFSYLQGAASIFKGTSQALSTYHQVKRDKDEAKLQNLSFEIDNNDQHLKKLMDTVNRLTEEFLAAYEKQSEFEQRRQRVISEMMQKV